MWRVNPMRLFENLSEDKVNEVARAAAALATKHVFKAIVIAWGVFLLALFALLLTIRIAVTLPLPWQL